jgi:hypothetical protein
MLLVAANPLPELGLLLVGLPSGRTPAPEHVAVARGERAGPADAPDQHRALRDVSARCADRRGPTAGVRPASSRRSCPVAIRSATHRYSFKIDPPQPCSGEPEAADGTSVKACETEDLADWLGGRHLNPDNVVQRDKKK